MDASAKGLESPTKRTFAVVYWYRQDTSPPWGSNLLRIIPVKQLKRASAAREGVVDHIRYGSYFYPVLVLDIIVDTTFLQLSCNLYNGSVEKENRGLLQSVTLGLHRKRSTSDGEIPINSESPGPHQRASSSGEQLPSTNKAVTDTTVAAAPSGHPTTSHEPEESPTCSSGEIQIKFETINSIGDISRWLSDDFLASFATDGSLARPGTSLEAVHAALRNARDVAGEFLSQLQQSNRHLGEVCQALSSELLMLRSSSASETAELRLKNVALERDLADQKTAMEAKLTEQKNEQTVAFDKMLKDQIRKMKENNTVALEKHDKEGGIKVDTASDNTAAAAWERLMSAKQAPAGMLPQVPAEHTGRLVPSPALPPVPDNHQFQRCGQPYYGFKRRGGRGFQRGGRGFRWGGGGRGGFDGNGAHRGYRPRSPSSDMYANGPADKLMHYPQHQKRC